MEFTNSFNAKTESVQTNKSVLVKQSHAKFEPLSSSVISCEVGGVGRRGGPSHLVQAAAGKPGATTV